MDNKDVEVFNTSGQDRRTDPYEQFLNKGGKISPNKGRPFWARLIGVSATELIFEGRHGLVSVYRRDAIRSIIWDEVA